MSTWELKEKSCGELTCVVENETWSNAKTKAFAKLAKNVEVPGFRKGQAPKKIVEKHLNRNSVLLEAVELVANDALMEGVKEHSLEVIAQPELKVNGLDEDKAELVFVITVKPEVTLGQYKELPMEKDAVEVTEEDVNAELTRLQERFAEMEVKETAENGDTVVIDFEGFKDGVPFEGGKAEKYSLVLGSNSFIPGFEDQLIGVKAEDEKDVNVTFPEDYHAAELAGAPVVFKIKVHEVKTKVLPELDDEFAKDVNAPDVETIEDLKAFITKNLTDEKEKQAENKAVNTLMETVVNNASVEIPQAMIDNETNQLVNEYAMQLQQNGFSLDQFLKMTGQKMEDLKAQFETDATNRVKFRLVLEAIAKAESIDANDEEIEKEYQDIANSYNMKVEEVKNLIAKDTLIEDVKARKAYDLIKDTASK
ncbi:MAG: trigger factor [Erysipelotrichaceae bacterium]|nr:trigger factor [Erysipelotrichaceae bacterium]